MASSVEQHQPLLRDAATARRILRQMMLIRRFEERTEEQYTRARIGGYCHLAIGEEAANVGAIEPLGDSDYLFTSYRDHGAALAVGSEPAGVMAELFGKATGVAGGYGGSMHLLDVERRFLGGWGIVGGHLPIAVGAALALDYTGSDGVVLCQLGDGATNTGGFHEALNLAAVWKLPIIFQVINNQYGMGTSVAMASAETELWKRAAAYEMHGERVDGNDVEAVYDATTRLHRPGATRPQAVADRDAHLPLPRPLRRRRRQGLPHRRGDRLLEGARPDHAVRRPRDGGRPADRRGRHGRPPRGREPGRARPSRRPRRLPRRPFGPVRPRLQRPGTAEQFARMDTAGPFGERKETRGWRT